MIALDNKTIQDITFRQIQDLTRQHIESFDIQFSDRRVCEVEL